LPARIKTDIIKTNSRVKRIGVNSVVISYSPQNVPDTEIPSGADMDVVRSAFLLSILQSLFAHNSGPSFQTLRNKNTKNKRLSLEQAISLLTSTAKKAFF